MSNVKGLEEFTDAKSMRAWQEDYHKNLKITVGEVIKSIFNFAKHNTDTELKFKNLSSEVIEALKRLGYGVKMVTYEGEDQSVIITW